LAEEAEKLAEEARIAEEVRVAEEAILIEAAEKLADKQEKASIADSGIDSPDYNEKNGHGFDLDLKKNPKYEDEDNVKPVLCCCIQ